jgi:hypothetical protein
MIDMLALSRMMPALIAGMRFIEKLVLGLLASFVVANVAILASALPYIYALEDNIRCGSLGITNLAMDEIYNGIVFIITQGAMLYGGRFLISVCRIVWVRVLGILFWCIGLGIAVLSLLLFGTFVNMVRNPLPFPPDLNLKDTKACSEFIYLHAMPYAPDWFHSMQRMMGQR